MHLKTDRKLGCLGSWNRTEISRCKN